MKTVALPGAKGHLTLSGTFSTFDLAGDERELVFALIDKMKAYEAVWRYMRSTLRNRPRL